MRALINIARLFGWVCSGINILFINKMYLLLTILLFKATIAYSADPYGFEDFNSQHDYFKKITLGEYLHKDDQFIAKWSENIKVYVKGSFPAVLENELNVIIRQLNQIIMGIKLTKVDSDNKANLVIFSGLADDYLRHEPRDINQSLPIGNHYNLDINPSNEVANAKVYIDPTMYNSEKLQKHVLRKVITKSLGLSYESRKYFDSIFAEHPWSYLNTKYSNFDKTIINLFYSDCIKAGMNHFELDQALKNDCDTE